MIPHDPHVLRKQSFEDRIQWWDKKHPEFKHKQSKWGSLLPSNKLTPALVVSHLAKSDAEISRTLSPSDQGLRAFGMCGEDLEVDVCRKLCEQGRIANAVDALDLLVQRRCYVPSNLFCRLLKRCIALKDLVSGRLIHGLAVQSGYEGDPFVATQLIGLYASRGKLKDAMRVFTSVPTPNAYNWASIIFAFARDKDSAGAAEAVRLYGQMRQSTTVEPDDRVYSAVLKACATARNLAAGKEVHGHILANAEKPDRFVQAGLVDMYSKCGSLEDARSVFDTLAEKNVVVWNAMIAGYAKQGMR